MSTSTRRFELKGCRVLPAQVWGSVRLAGIVRDEVQGDLRLAPQKHDDWRVRSTYKRADFTSYMPRAFVLNWETDGSATASSETHLGKHQPIKLGRLWRRRSKKSLAFLPQSLAIEGYLVQHFKGPDVAWLDYQRMVRRGSLGVRIERTLPGWYLNGLKEALRLFEFAPNQVGAAVYIDEELINCFVTPHPADYARLHESLLEDSYPEHLLTYGYLRDRDPGLSMDLERVSDLTSLRQEFERATAELVEEEKFRLDILSGRELESKRLFKCGPFALERFLVQLEEHNNFCGEMITRKDGTLEYLKLYRLSRAQSKRLRFLKTLAKHNWSLEAAAQELRFPRAEGMARALVGADLGYILNPGVHRT